VQDELLYQRALAIAEQKLGPDHPETAATLNNLALLYRDQGNSAQAEPPYQRALERDERAFGPEHPEVATDLEGYAALLHVMTAQRRQHLCWRVLRRSGPNNAPPHDVKSFCKAVFPSQTDVLKEHYGPIRPLVCLLQCASSSILQSGFRFLTSQVTRTEA